jgi:L-ascorbate metabolism protein UlaG (beta-lactamase superfamily)
LTERRLVTERASIPLRRSGPDAQAALSAFWLGQAGFLIESFTVRLVVDAYLSDTLAHKHRGEPLPHVRMAPPPVEPGALADVDLVLSTHGHTDHLDPGTLPCIAEANPGCRFVVPASISALAVSRGVPADRLVPARAFESFQIAGVKVHPLPSAHEDLAVDQAGQHLCLGYVIELGGAAVYHPGDCVPYPDLVGNLASYPIDLALLPINGRDARRAAAGVPGNFTLEEAICLATRCGFGAVIGHHFGLFDFNTIDLEAARARLDTRSDAPPFVLAEHGVRYSLRDTTEP